MQKGGNNTLLLGAIIGDAAGSIYEWNPIKFKPERLNYISCHITDDSIMTVAVADAILTGGNYVDKLRYWGRRYPHVGYGGRFLQWIYSENPLPYQSYGNGSGMRVSPCGWISDDLDEVLLEAEKSARVTHDSIEGITGAKAIAHSIWMMKMTGDKSKLADVIKLYYPDYDLTKTVSDRLDDYTFDVSCQGSVPQSIQCVIESVSYEDAIRTAISFGGDSDTMACMAGSIASVLWDIPQYLVNWVGSLIPDDTWMIINKFNKKYGR